MGHLTRLASKNDHGLISSRTGKWPHIKAAARDAIGVSTVRSGRRFCSFAGCQQLVKWGP